MPKVIEQPKNEGQFKRQPIHSVSDDSFEIVAEMLLKDMRSIASGKVAPIHAAKAAKLAIKRAQILMPK